MDTEQVVAVLSGLLGACIGCILNMRGEKKDGMANSDMDRINFKIKFL